MEESQKKLLIQQYGIEEVEKAIEFSKLVQCEYFPYVNAILSNRSNQKNMDRV